LQPAKIPAGAIDARRRATRENERKHMQDQKLNGKAVAILVTDGFEQVELEQPREALRLAGADTDVIAPHKNPVQGFEKHAPGRTVEVDRELKGADPSDYDALLLPGGVMNPDTLRTIPEAVEFAKAFFEAGKPVAAICHGPQLLIEANVVRGRKLTSFPSLKTDLANAGAKWLDQAVVVDQGLVTSRRPDDIPQFNAKMIEEFAEGVHAGPRAAARS
jgi:protease I